LLGTFGRKRHVPKAQVNTTLCIAAVGLLPQISTSR
jgi:hypothetical protein